ncbi:bifunctional homocysteine S-methyltransferase/methylenetetrahydrofolate reductase [Paenibacillus endoradicis]|uniref:bifunctional homocysteine S-methyltransferase/methylenetetrahydrofolate reductase n=1 Tax=Paenibacillus endoradicis TaxID=2972487 RepID=UPI002158E3A5|nr:bifunctional homocysteine S-methyltransferase/methylenetetrahydrofolate reductase [Paenibacillus endoradicis]MCR8656108.1 bifunctional homocysteine S-methyltransferase/methylenetetrahydrofolate reductase [Paenibacillus endoradicis]MCR8658434.1 bifunctional homocysteine S-methyltransferase/methylenetetrahydrofolate reductase [Paenibacillus endoradicis]
MDLNFRDALKQRILVGDGAMGTFLYKMGFPIGVPYEQYNVLKPEVVLSVHQQYVDAGAQVIQTNTYQANRVKFARYGIEDQVDEINRAAVRLARQAAGDKAFVVGTVGSIRDGKRGNVRTLTLTNALHEQIHALLSENVDGLLFETFYDLEEIKLAVRIAREESNIPIICQFAAEDSGRTVDGYTLEEAFVQLKQEGADVIGFNCRTGPNGILKLLDSIDNKTDLPYSVYPNAGAASFVDGKYEYTAGPDYFASMATKFADRGAHIIGGCCGTTPNHVKAMADALEDYVPVPVEALNVLVKKSNNAATSNSPSKFTWGTARRNEQTILDKVKERHTVIVELDPPRDLDISKFMEGAAALKEIEVDAITMADNSLAVTRMSNLALAALVQEQIGITPLIHIACRDRNLIGTQSHLMGLDALGIDHVLAVTGDPARFGDLPDSSSVYDMTSFELIRMTKQLNDGVAFSGKPLKQRANFVVGAAFNPNVKHLDKAVQRLEKKIAAGADYIMTQPVYDVGLIERIAESTKHLSVPIFIGIMPLANGRNAEYLHNEVPGIQLSDAVRARMAGLEGEIGRAEGVKIAQELLDCAIKHFKGIYLMTPFLHYNMAVQLTEYVHTQTQA